MSIIAVFLTSLAGSPHCAGMCGGFVSLYSSRAERTATAHTAYHFGRLISYGTLGTLAGAFGHSFDRLGQLAGVHHAATLVLSIILIWTGLSLVTPTLVRRLIDGTIRRTAFRGADPRNGAKPFHLLLHRLLHKTIGTVSARSPSCLPFALGFFTTLLPCGWLYLWVATAAAAGSALSGAGTMLIFWLGTLPALLLVGGGARLTFSRLSPHIPRILGIVLLLGGISSLVSHNSGRLANGAPACPHDSASPSGRPEESTHGNGR